MCPTLGAEWKKHRSIFATKWLASMIAKKRINRINPQATTKTLIVDNLKDKKIAIALKDAHLIDGALEVDCIIASNDDIARSVFCELSITCGSLRAIKWFNAIADREIVTDYLVSDGFVPKKYYLVAETTAI
ncbi:hypothetical protein H5185_20720 [Shewanella sp. SG44-6]|nr:hypothetical protein [Shewanella sp. SG44-6]